MSRSFSAFSTMILVVIAMPSYFVVQDTSSNSRDVYVRETGQGLIILLSHIHDLAGIFYEGPKPCHWGIVLKSRYIAQNLFQHPKIPCPASHFNSRVASHEAIYSQVQLLYILHKITSGLIDIQKELNHACECIIDVLGKAGPLLLI
jgi:hypothetical protein